MNECYKVAGQYDVVNAWEARVFITFLIFDIHLLLKASLNLRKILNTLDKSEDSILIYLKWITIALIFIVLLDISSRYLQLSIYFVNSQNEFNDKSLNLFAKVYYTITHIRTETFYFIILFFGYICMDDILIDKKLLQKNKFVLTLAYLYMFISCIYCLVLYFERCSPQLRRTVLMGLMSLVVALLFCYYMLSYRKLISNEESFKKQVSLIFIKFDYSFFPTALGLFTRVIYYCLQITSQLNDIRDYDGAKSSNNFYWALFSLFYNSLGIIIPIYFIATFFTPRRLAESAQV